MLRRCPASLSAARVHSLGTHTIRRDLRVRPGYAARIESGGASCVLMSEGYVTGCMSAMRPVESTFTIQSHCLR